MTDTIALEGVGVTVQFGSSDFTSDVLAITLSERAREAIETTHLGTVAAKTYKPGEVPDLGTVELLLDHNPYAVHLVGRPAEDVTIRYPDTEAMEYDPIVIHGFAISQGGERMFPDDRMVTAVTLKITTRAFTPGEVVPPEPVEEGAAELWEFTGHSIQNEATLLRIPDTRFFYSWSIT